MTKEEFKKLTKAEKRVAELEDAMRNIAEYSPHIMASLKLKWCLEIARKALGSEVTLSNTEETSDDMGS